jgi:exopolyphosphatase/guanosine-5'-triphosphate,3'-diphosphate pyrophosphatase
VSHQPIAAIDVGSNTVHMLVGKLEDDGIRTLDDRTALVRLAMDLAPDGALNGDKMDWAADVIGDFHARAQALHADPILLVATSAVREAPNGHDLVELILQRTGIDLRIISGEEEARLTFAGATLDRKVDGRLGVVDSGGGSTELILAHDGQIVSARSVPEGAGRTVERFLHDDPPSAAQIWALRVHLMNVLDALPHPEIDRLIVTGGSANNLRRLAHGRDGDERLEIGEAQEVLRMLAQTSSAEVARHYGIDALRARTLLGGITIVVTLWERSGLNRAIVSPTGIREGMILLNGTDGSAA